MIFEFHRQIGMVGEEGISYDSKIKKFFIFSKLRMENNYSFKLDLSDEIEKQLLIKLNKLKIWDWKKDYNEGLKYEHVPDMEYWNLHISMKGHKIKSKGYAEYPKKFNLLLKYLNELFKSSFYLNDDKE